MLRLNAHLGYQFTEFEPWERFTQAARAGFKAVEWPAIYAYEPERLKATIDALSLRWVQVALPFGDTSKGEKGLAALPGREDEFIQGLRDAIHYAKTLGACWIHPMAGVVREWNEVVRTVYLKNLQRALDEASVHGLGVLVEVIGNGEVPGYAMSDYRRAAEVFATLSGQPPHLLLDAYHAQTITGDAIGLVGEWAGRIGHVQIADVPGRHEPGTGNIDFNGFFSALQSAGYEGWVGCEYKPLNGTLPGLARLADYASFLGES